ncbi:IQ and ubiquitin-like domain-containing protein [Salmo salar]|uniref:IQ and ubiquitin-like domain-containing protein n=1 Tax=Salmo salar TaxID=8030 RepID=A0ABM3CBX6_SALSA|nr:IQ and ubiquitin-like domain-containing protein [Salmo salar]|eukprot:XP_013980055.1 PREDICTED: IQ and ubiquitin-like domain-containing protein [Salmo salar]
MSEEDAETSGLNGNADEQNVKKEGKSPEAEFDESQVESNTIEHPPPDVQDSDTGVKTETGELVGEAVHKSTFLTSGEEDTVEATAQADLPEDSRQDEASPKKTTFSNEVGNSTATVKILLMPEGHMMTMAFAIGLTVKELKYHFANELKVPSELIQISQSGRMVEDHRTLIELGVQPHGTIQLEMNSSDPENHPIRPVKPQQDYNMPDVITVRVQTETETFQDVVVEIERATHRKAFLGGYRHKATETEYHHAAVQTIAKRKPIRGVGTFSRDTQTVTVKSQSQQCTNSTSTQMTKIGCYVSNMEDKLISPGSYVTAAQYHGKRLRAVITLQMYTRRWQAKRMTDQLRQDREMRLAWMEREGRRKREEKEVQIKAEYHRRMNPQCRDDFALLYSALEKWRREEVEHIDATLDGAERKAALCALLEQESQLIASIGRHRIAAGERNYDKAVQAFLEKCAAPKRWRAFDGKMTQVDTQYTIRAKELRDLYSSINLHYLNQEERLDVLLTLKHTVKEHDCKLTQNIVELIDREADLLMRGVKETNLEGLRKRISTLFLQYIKNPTFNPEVAKLLKVPQDPAQLRKNIYFCRGCSRYLLSTDFSLTANARLVGKCRSCSELDNEARRREDFSHYKTILRRLRKTEAQRNKEAKITYLLQEQDLRYLVDVVWGAQSALSAWSDMHDLVMVRWDCQWEWSPWNCILLTKEEAAAHIKMENIEKAYGVVFIRNVKHKHTVAKKYFSKIPVMVKYLQDVDSQSAAHGNLLVAKPINTVTARILTTTPQAAGGKATQ